MKIRPQDDVSSQHSTLTFYQSSFPKESAYIIAKNKAVNEAPIKKNGLPISKKKELIDEVKQLIARNKVLRCLEANVLIRKCLRARLRQLAVQA